MEEEKKARNVLLVGSIKGVTSKKQLIGAQRGTEAKLICLQGMKRIVNSLPNSVM